ncbi:reverse transcriptase domain-containing protein [Burkholderia ubonensis]|uniref:reverse transcriptase domain-containing protein n=1 Tax=Burkholderia ubonensis TaxID=101571 RepID=UPI000A7344A2|nr:reverse transcriptase domain-containing protein [Burkholderia ubonensis]
MRKVPAVFTLMHLAHLTGTSWQSLRNTITRQQDDYRVFEIRKRSGGNRRICAPAPMLKSVQFWIHKNILCSLGARALLQEASTAYAPGSSIKKNAAIHAGAAWLIKLDIKDFFESISERQVYHVFRRLGYPALLSFEMARLCTRVVPPRDDKVPRRREKMWRWTNQTCKHFTPYPCETAVGHLPQGAPTSAMLANLVAVELDKKIQVIADANGASYTRYADDIVLTLAVATRVQCDTIFRAVADVVSHSGFRVNRIKSHVRGPGARKVVTGLVINDVRPRLARSMREDIKLALYHIKKHGLLGHAERRHSKNPLGYLNHLVGLIYFARSIEQDFGVWALSELRIAMDDHKDLLSILRTFDSSQDQRYSYRNI